MHLLRHRSEFQPILGLVAWCLFYPVRPYFITLLFTYFWIFDAEHSAFHIVDIQVLKLSLHTKELVLKTVLCL